MSTNRIDLVNRRGVLGLAIALPAAALATAAAAASAGGCVGLASLPSEQASMRASLGYQLVSDDANKVCAGCSFYTPGATADCGACSLLMGPTTAKSRCDSWSAK